MPSKLHQDYARQLSSTPIQDVWETTRVKFLIGGCVFVTFASTALSRDTDSLIARNIRKELHVLEQNLPLTSSQHPSHRKGRRTSLKALDPWEFQKFHKYADRVKGPSDSTPPKPSHTTQLPAHTIDIVFESRSGKLFLLILNYLRHGAASTTPSIRALDLSQLHLLTKEAAFFQLQGLSRLLRLEIERRRVSSKPSTV